jgi:hypothetical protein
MPDANSNRYRWFINRTDLADQDMAQRKNQKSTPIGTLLPALLGPATQRFGFPVAALVADWRAIAGDELAARCLPRALEKRQGGPRGRSGATLVVAARPEHMLDIDYARDTLRARVNDYLGRPFLATVRVTSEDDLELAPINDGKAEQTAESDPALAADVAERTRDIADEGLRHTLERLGQSVLHRKTDR